MQAWERVSTSKYPISSEFSKGISSFQAERCFMYVGSLLNMVDYYKLVITYKLQPESLRQFSIRTGHQKPVIKIIQHTTVSFKTRRLQASVSRLLTTKDYYYNKRKMRRMRRDVISNGKNLVNFRK